MIHLKFLPPLLLFLSAGSLTATIHADPAGSDISGDGSEAHPYRTLAKAVDASRMPLIFPRIIILHDGSYERTSVTLTPRDSGLQIIAAPGAKPLLIGGTRVTAWKSEDNGWWSTSLNALQEGYLDFRTLVVTGTLAQRSRYPAEGEFHNEARFDVHWKSTSEGGWERKPTQDELTTLIYSKNDLGDWLQTKNAEFTVYHAWDESLVEARSMDFRTRTVRFKTPCSFPPGAFSDWAKRAGTYVIWNIREGMTRPGEWYLDRVQGKLYYWPKSGESPDNTEIIVPSTYAILRLEGTGSSMVSDVHIQGISFMATTTPLKPGGFGGAGYEGAITGRKVTRLSIGNVIIRGVGGHGLLLDDASHCTLRNCKISDVGCGGAVLLGSDNSIVENNLLANTGMLLPSGIGLWVSGSGIVVSHNTIRGTSYTGIAAGGANIGILNNRIEDFMRTMDDGGAIYLDHAESPTVSENLIIGHGSSGEKEQKNHASGIYLDELTQNAEVRENVVINQYFSVHLHMSTKNTFTNNFFLTDSACRFDFQRSTGTTFQNNVVQSGGAVFFTCATTETISLINNIFWPSRGGIWFQAEGNKTKPTPWAPTTGSLIDNPLLIENQGSYQFSPGSPAKRLKIKALEVKTTGASLDS